MKKTYLFIVAFIFLYSQIINAQSNREIQKKNLNSSSSSPTYQEISFSESVNRARQFSPNGVVRCVTTEYTKQKQREGLVPTDEEFERWLAPKIQEIKRLRTIGRLPSVIRIPVVVHVIHNGDAIGTGENIADGQVLSQITVFNQDFRRMIGTPGYNTNPVGADTTIEFCMAQVDPNGNPTNGIDRRNLGIASFDNAAVETAKANTIWDPTKYLNMWTFNFGGDLSGVLGYAQFPSGSGLEGMPTANCIAGEASTDGVVSAYSTFGSRTIFPSGIYSGTSYDKGRTMTHEVGHMFGLRHIWGDGGCGVDDFCADTPLSDAANFGCPTTNSCVDIPVDLNDQVQNYMDYSDDACMNIFTQDQKDRMLAVLMNSPRRDDLLTSTVCNPVSTPYIQFKRQVCEQRIAKSIIEGNGCSYTEFTVPLNIDKAPSANAVVNFFIDAASQADASDIQIMTPSLTFNSGSTADQNLVFRIFNDGLQEADEELIISFTVNANGGDAVMNSDGNVFSLTIINDDSAPALVETLSLINEDFEDPAGWLLFDADGDGRDWGLVNADGLGTPPNTISGTCAFSEKRLSYLSGSATNANPNNYFISPQVSIPANATSVSFSYIVAGYDNTAQTRNAGNYSVYFTTSIANEAAILAGTLIQANATVNENTSQLRTYNLLALAGQTGYIVFRHNNTGTSNVGLLLLDTVLLQAVATKNVQTEVNNATRYQATFPSSGTIYSSDATTGRVMANITSTVNFNYGCTTVEVDRSQVSVGASTASFIDTSVGNRVLSKTFFVNPTNDSASGNFTIKLYFTEAEVAAWEAATGKSRTSLRIIKVVDNSISSVNSTNYENFTITEVPVTIGAFGTNVTFEATFNSNLRGGYAVGPATGLICGDFATTWNGTTWSSGVPTKLHAVTISGNYSSTANLEACSLTILTGANAVINPNHTLIVTGNVQVNAGGSLTIENNAALRQLNDTAINTGSITVKRVSSPMRRLDYTAWSTPVIGQQLLAFSPNTITTRFYEYLYTGTTTPTAYQSVNPNNNFVAGKGYMIRAADNWSSTVPSAYNGQFSGTPINGIITQNVGLGYNLLGNPYPSPIGANKFLLANSSIGTLYFWTNTTPASGGVYPQNNFASYTTLGGAAAFGSAIVPNGIIQTGQGFYIQTTAATDVNFANDFRENASVSTQFYRTSNEVTSVAEKHRIWLNLNDSNVSYNQTLVGYMDGATTGFDNSIDGRILDDSKPMLYSVLNADKLVIQGKGLPFTDEDIVPLGLKVLVPGNYSISLENVDGLFVNQDVFVKDKYANVIHDIKQGAYSFTSQDGTFEDRFELVYKNTTLGGEDIVNENALTVYTSSNGIVVNSSEQITEVVVFDVLGRKLYQQNVVNQEEVIVTKIIKSNQALFVKTTLTNGQVITKKVIY
jgi:hypothetical protein